ncbi:uncharacterized protein M6B38_101040 [Iris pallida]|uniref:Glutaredoxin domain-containing protein n=1 Tax=Iris pallida TaxID=29817 RepID=A0AAX6ILA2_IRIPA|nr:uncharacterized protein M6B38_101040 [Iris pallida]
MGCTISKGVEVVAATDVYRPPATSIALFDVNSIDEPWLRKNREKDADRHEEEEEEEKKPMHIPLPLLEKLENYELTPGYSCLRSARPWKISSPLSASRIQKSPLRPSPPQLLPSRNNNSSHWIWLRLRLCLPARPPPPEISGLRPVRENSFVIRDREEREKNSDNPKHSWRRRDPLEGYPERPPPGGRQGSVVLYTTTLGGVRRTYEDCDRVRKAVEAVAEDAGVEVDERDVSLHGEFLKEVRELAGGGAAVPRLFVMGRYVGGAEEVAELNETGKLKEMMRWVASRGGRREGSRRDCEGCGNARFVPCLDCSGSCKVLGEDGKEVVRCSNCNENGLVLCPLCH